MEGKPRINAHFVHLHHGLISTDRLCTELVIQDGKAGNTCLSTEIGDNRELKL
jgi:hypothetical protein